MSFTASFDIRKKTVSKLLKLSEANVFLCEAVNEPNSSVDIDWRQFGWIIVTIVICFNLISNFQFHEKDLALSYWSHSSQLLECSVWACQWKEKEVLQKRIISLSWSSFCFAFDCSMDQNELWQLHTGSLGVVNLRTCVWACNNVVLHFVSYSSGNWHSRGRSDRTSRLGWILQDPLVIRYKFVGFSWRSRPIDMWDSVRFSWRFKKQATSHEIWKSIPLPGRQCLQNWPQPHSVQTRWTWRLWSWHGHWVIHLKSGC